jgi:hypothetical protein
MNIQIVLGSAALVAAFASTPAQADKAAYCQAYARDFSDQRATDKIQWQHKYQIALDACLGSGKKTTIAAKPVIVDKPPIVAAAAQPAPKPPLVAKPAPEPTVKPASTDAQPNLVMGTPEWNDYCAKKYTSFSTKTGMYLSHTGASRRCLVTKDLRG